MAVGAFFTVLGDVKPADVGLADLRHGFGARDLSAVATADPGLFTSMLVILLGVAALMLLGSLVGSRIVAGLGVLAGLGTLGVFGYRVHDRFGAAVTDNLRALAEGRWGLYLVAGGLAVALLAVVVPRERM